VLDQKLGNTERALEPGCWRSWRSDQRRGAPNLRRYAATTGDHSPWVEALIRVGVQDIATRPKAPAIVCASCASGGRRLAIRRSWPGACGGTASRTRSDELLRAEQVSSEPAKLAEQELEAALAELTGLAGDARVPVLRQVAAALRGFPSRSEQYVGVLWELTERAPRSCGFGACSRRCSPHRRCRRTLPALDQRRLRARSKHCPARLDGPVAPRAERG